MATPNKPQKPAPTIPSKTGVPPKN